MNRVSDTKTHVLNLAIGDRFKFRLSGPTFIRVAGRDERIWVKEEGSPLPRHVLDHGGCYVFPIDVDRSDQ